jgi:hypothetical protein
MMKNEPQLELERLRKQQSKAREDEVFGGLNPDERLAYNLRQNRIRALEDELELSEERQAVDLWWISR